MPALPESFTATYSAGTSKLTRCTTMCSSGPKAAPAAVSSNWVERPLSSIKQTACWCTSQPMISMPPSPRLRRTVAKPSSERPKFPPLVGGPFSAIPPEIVSGCLVERGRNPDSFLIPGRVFPCAHESTREYAFFVASLWHQVLESEFQQFREGLSERAKNPYRNIPGSLRCCNRVRQPVEPIGSRVGLKIPGGNP